MSFWDSLSNLRGRVEKDNEINCINCNTLVFILKSQWDILASILRESIISIYVERVIK